MRRSRRAVVAFVKFSRDRDAREAVTRTVRLVMVESRSEARRRDARRTLEMIVDGRMMCFKLTHES